MLFATIKIIFCLDGTFFMNLPATQNVSAVLNIFSIQSLVTNSTLTCIFNVLYNKSGHITCTTYLIHPQYLLAPTLILCWDIEKKMLKLLEKEENLGLNWLDLLKWFVVEKTGHPIEHHQVEHFQQKYQLKHLQPGKKVRGWNLWELEDLGKG